jgi:hypothetical protein
MNKKIYEGVMSLKPSAHPQNETKCSQVPQSKEAKETKAALVSLIND